MIKKSWKKTLKIGKNWQNTEDFFPRSNFRKNSKSKNICQLSESSQWPFSTIEWV